MIPTRWIGLLTLSACALSASSAEWRSLPLAEFLLETQPKSALIAYIPTHCDGLITIEADGALLQTPQPAAAELVTARSVAMDIERCGLGPRGFISSLEKRFSDLPRTDRLEIEFRRLMQELELLEQDLPTSSGQSDAERLASEMGRINARLDVILDELQVAGID